MRERISRLEKESANRADDERRSGALASLANLQRGDVIVLPKNRRAGPVVILDPANTGMDAPRPVVLGLDRRVRRLAVSDFPSPVEPVGRLRIPRKFHDASATDRRHLAERLLEFSHSIPASSRHQPTKPALSHEIDELRRALRRHPCHGCNEREDHARWAERYYRLRRKTDSLSNRVANRTNNVARQFDHVCDVLLELGYLAGEGDEVSVAPSGRMLAGVYGDNDLLTCESIRRGLWDGLSPAELAAVCAALVYESRNPDSAQIAARLPGGEVPAVLHRMAQAYEDLRALEKRHLVEFVRAMDHGFSHAAYRWATGAKLEQVLWESDLTPGDFVRWCKQLLDLLGQIQRIGVPALSRTAGAAADAISRSVVAYSGVE
jgi:ATP-dependent RNA helicase HelY